MRVKLVYQGQEERRVNFVKRVVHFPNPVSYKIALNPRIPAYGLITTRGMKRNDYESKVWIAEKNSGMTRKGGWGD